METKKKNCNKAFGVDAYNSESVSTKADTPLCYVKLHQS